MFHTKYIDITCSRNISDYHEGDRKTEKRFLHTTIPFPKPSSSADYFVEPDITEWTTVGRGDVSPAIIYPHWHFHSVNGIWSTSHL